MDMGWIWGGFSMEFMDLGWISMDLGWSWGGFSLEFMDLGWISMDLAWIFYGCHGCRVNFHGVDIDE